MMHAEANRSATRRPRGPQRPPAERARLATEAARIIREVTRAEGAPPGVARLAEALGISRVQAEATIAALLRGGVRVCPCGRQIRQPGATRCFDCGRASRVTEAAKPGRRIPRGGRFELAGRGRRWCAGGHVVDVRGFAPETLRAVASEGDGGLCVNCRAGEPVYSSVLVWWDETVVPRSRGPVNAGVPVPVVGEPDAGPIRAGDVRRRLDQRIRHGDYDSILDLARRHGVSDDYVRARARELGVDIGGRRGRKLAFGPPIGGGA